MFYSAELLSIKSHSGLGIIWLAATLGNRSQTKRLSRKDYTNVDIVKSCEFVIQPPEPLSLRLASNLMIGITRIYGQQCQFYYHDAQNFISKIVMIDSNKPTKDASTKAPVGAITHAIAEDVELSNSMILSGPLDLEALLLATPEVVREQQRLSKSLSSKVPSLEPSSSVAGLPFDVGMEPADWGWDWGDVLKSGPFDMEDFKHGALNDKKSMQSIPETVTKKPKLTRKNKKANLFDDEITLDRKDLLLGEGEGLLERTPFFLTQLFSSLNPNLLNSKNNNLKRSKRSKAGPELGRDQIPNDQLPPLNEDYGIDDIPIPDYSVPNFVAAGPTLSSSVNQNLSPIPQFGSSISGSRSPSSPFQPDWNIPTQITNNQQETLEFLSNIQDLCGSSGRGEIEFKRLLTLKKRLNVAQSFHKVLVLVSSGAINVRQSGPYEKIIIQK